MKSISISDLKLIPELSKFTSIDFLNPDNDAIIAPYLQTLGFDLEYPVEFIPSQHRNMQGKCVVDFRIVGDMEINRAFLTSAWATAEDLVIASGYRDLSLASDMASQLTTNREYGTEGEAEKGFPVELTNEDEGDILKQIMALESILLSVRGNPFKNDGSRKLYAESHLTEAPPKMRKKVVKKT